MSRSVQYMDRYEALGMPQPERATMCKGQCEGVGVYPVFLDHLLPLARAGEARPVQAPTTLEERIRWEAQHNAPDAHAPDMYPNGCEGWHFIKCPDCDGTGKAKA